METELAGVDILIIKVSQLFSFLSSGCFLREIENMCRVLFNNPSYSCILIGSGLWSISRILLVYQYKYCNLIGWAIAHHQLLVYSGWNSSTKWWRFIFMEFMVSWPKKSWNYWKNNARACTTSIFNANSIRAIHLRCKSNNKSRDNWKPLFEVNFSTNSTKTIRLFVLNFYLNNRVFLSRNYRVIVAPRKFDVLKTNICPRSEASRANVLVLRTSSFQEATIRPIIPRH